MERSRSSRGLLVLGSIAAVAIVGLLAYSTIASALLCAEHDELFNQRNCPDWFQGRSPRGTLVMLCAYLGPFLTLIAAIASVVSRRARYVITTGIIVSTPMMVVVVGGVGSR
jgi:hypothetical protein